MADVMIMEDDAAFAFSVRSMLEWAGHEVHWCRSGTEGIALLSEKEIDLIVSDIFVVQNGRITEDGGLPLIAKAAQTDGTKHGKKVPVIAITGAATMPGNQHILDVARTLGATYALKKPFSEDDLLSLVTDVLDSR